MMAVGRDRRNGEKRHGPAIGSAAAGLHHGFPGLDPEAKKRSAPPESNSSPAWPHPLAYTRTRAPAHSHLELGAGILISGRKNHRLA